MGGGEHRARNSYERFGRFGGTQSDAHNYIRLFDTVTPFDGSLLYKYKKEFRETLFPHPWTSLGLDEVLRDFSDLTLDTNPGPSYVALGYQKKYECLDAAHLMAKNILEIMKGGGLTPPTLWSLAFRPKLLKLTEALEKIEAKGPLARVIWMPDFHENFLSKMLTIPIMKETYRAWNGDNPICIGFSKFSDGPLFARQIRGYHYYLTLDWSKFDVRISGELISFVLNLFEENFTDDVSAQFRYARETLINTTFVSPEGDILQKNRGLPTGSSWTSLVGSVANYVMLESFFKHHRIPKKDYKILVFGDNSLLCIKHADDLGHFISHPHEMIRILAEYCLESFGMKINPKEAKVAFDDHVAINHCQYFLERDLSGGTSGMKPDRIVTQKSDSICIGALDNKWQGSHRWNYSFERSATFLSMSLAHNDTFIRPAFEVFLRLYHPERVINTIEEHINNIVMILLENISNKHVVNRCYHYLFDAMWMKRNGWGPTQAFQDSKVKYEERPDELVSTSDRLWYRRQKKYVDTLKEPQMQEFNETFSAIVSKILGTYERSNLHLSDFWRFRSKRYLPSNRSVKLDGTDSFFEMQRVLMREHLLMDPTFSRILEGKRVFESNMTEIISKLEKIPYGNTRIIRPVRDVLRMKRRKVARKLPSQWLKMDPLVGGTRLLQGFLETRKRQRYSQNTPPVVLMENVLQDEMMESSDEENPFKARKRKRSGGSEGEQDEGGGPRRRGEGGA